MASIKSDKGVEALGPAIPDDSSLSSRDVDDNYRVYRETQELQATKPEIKAVVRKIDVRVVTILFFTYMLQYLDKNSINFASVYGLKEGTNLQGQDYSWLGL